MISSADSLLDTRRQPLRLWWRDDDAGEYHQSLGQIISISESLKVPLAVAAVPDWLAKKSAQLLCGSEMVTVLQHGWDHADHAPPGKKKIELGGSVEPDEMISGLRTGKAVLTSLCGDRFFPVLVPPWNRIEDRFLAELAGSGYVGVSTHRGDLRGRRHGLCHINTHVDVIDWRAGQRFIGHQRIVDEIARVILRWPDEPIGLLTHHAAMDQAAIAEVGEVIAQLQSHSNVVWCGARDLFGEGILDDTAAVDT